MFILVDSQFPVFAHTPFLHLCLNYFNPKILFIFLLYKFDLFRSFLKKFFISKFLLFVVG